MATTPPDHHREEIEEEYVTWARLCENKHGLPWPIKQDDLGSHSSADLLSEIKKLKVLGRTPPE
jgi:hypothetical protein